MFSSASSGFARQQGPPSLEVEEAGQAQPIELPAGAVALLMDLLAVMAGGPGVTVVLDSLCAAARAPAA